MTFKQPMIDAILAGRKTVTRRPAKSNGIFDDVLPCHYHQGGIYTVQPGRGKKGVAQIAIADVELTPLSDVLTEEEARREGFDSPQAFREYWIGLYGSFDDDEPVWRIEFELVGVPARV